MAIHYRLHTTPEGVERVGQQAYSEEICKASCRGVVGRRGIVPLSYPTRRQRVIPPHWPSTSCESSVLVLNRALQDSRLFADIDYSFFVSFVVCYEGRFLEQRKPSVCYAALAPCNTLFLPGVKFVAAAFHGVLPSRMPGKGGTRELLRSAQCARSFIVLLWTIIYYVLRRPWCSVNLTL